MTPPPWPPDAPWTRDAMERVHAHLCVAANRNPADARLVALRGEIAMHLRRWREAEQCFESFARQSGAHHLANYHLALLDFHRGRWETAWQRYESRIPINFPGDYRGLNIPVWNGEAIDGRRVLLVPEQGIGDTIQHLRYLPELTRRASRVRILACGSHRSLLESFLERELITAAADDGDTALFTCSLPLALGVTSPGDINAPYLHPDPDRAAAWQKRFAAIPGRKVAVAWAGNPASANDWNRSIPLRLLAPLATTPNVSLINFQFHEGRFPASAEDRRFFAADTATEIGPWRECAAALAACDLLVSVDTSIAHLGGALGLPVLLLLSWNADHRWTAESSSTPWYSNHRLICADEPGDWNGVIDAAASLLRSPPGSNPR